ncbi:MAG TPA: redoxin family protein [Solirubrobacteraceae bacterium]
MTSATEPNATLVTSTPGEMRRVAAQLVGVPIPLVVLCANGVYPLNLHEFSCGYPLVIYVYPGSEASPEGGGDTALMDAVQHRAFRERQSDLEARGYRTIGVSSQAAHAQRRAMLKGRLNHRLLSDPRLELAELLQLPTFTDERVRLYRRLTLIVHDGHIVKVFFPVGSAGRSAAQAVAWMTLQGIS